MIEVGLYNNIKLDCSIYDEYSYTIYTINNDNIYCIDREIIQKIIIYYIYI